MAIPPKFSFSPGQKVFLPYRQKLGLGNYRGFYHDVEKPANPADMSRQYKLIDEQGNAIDQKDLHLYRTCKM